MISVTETGTLAVIPFVEVAVITAEPHPIAKTVPFSDTSATLESEEDHVISGNVASAGVTVATSVCVSCSRRSKLTSDSSTLSTYFSLLLP